MRDRIDRRVHNRLTKQDHATVYTSDNGMKLPEAAIRELGILATKDEAGRHFTEWSGWWQELERAGLIEVGRPVHQGTGLSYSQEYWTLHVTDEGQQTVEGSPELWPED